MGTIVSVIALAVAVIVVSVQLYRWHAEPGRFDLRDLLTDKGSQRLSLAKSGQC